jgi:hypothetical protein
MKALVYAVPLGCAASLLIGLGAEPTALVSREAPQDLGPNHRLVRWSSEGPDAQGMPTRIAHEYTELELGLNYADPTTGAWLPAQAEFEQTRAGDFVARRTQFQAIVAGHLFDPEGTVDLLLPDGSRLRSAPLGVAVLDTQSGRSVMLGEAVDCPAEWVGPAEVLFRHAIPELGAHIRFRFGLGSFEQDVLIETQIEPELLAELGFDPARCRIMVLTEFFGAPTPTQRSIAPAGRIVEFGTMAIGPGQAFRTVPDSAGAKTLVLPSWERLERRQFLVESVDYPALAPLMDGLPRNAQGRAGTLPPGLRRTAGVYPFPVPAPREPRSGGDPTRKPAGVSTWKERAGLDTARRPWTRRLAAAVSPRPALVLDYALELSTGQTNFLFAGDKTYYVCSALPMHGTTTFEAGTVIKFAPTNNARLTLKGPVLWQGAAHRPVVLAARDDASVGDAVQYATNLSGYYAATALDIDRSTNSTAVVLQNFRITHAQTAIAVNGSTGHTFSHGQLVNCQNGIQPTNTGLDLRNILFHNVVTALSGAGSTGRCQHVTVNTATTFNLNATCSPLTVVNSLLAGVATNGTATLIGSVVLTNTSGVFQTVGQGANYLAQGSTLRDYAGASAQIDPDLASALRNLTTYPPLVVTNDFAAGTVFGPQAGRDLRADDLGYHYDPLDYAWSGRTLSGGALLLTNGVCVGLYGSVGTTLGSGAQFISEGLAENLNRIVHYATTQEQPGLWGSSGYGFWAVSAAANPAPELGLRFTRVSVLANSESKRALVNGANNPHALAIRDSQMHGVVLTVWSQTSSPIAIGLTNNLVERASLYVEQGFQASPFPVTCALFNNLFYRGQVTFYYYSTNTSAFTVKDNAFDNVSILKGGAATLDNSNNGYINSTWTSALTPTGTVRLITSRTATAMAGARIQGKRIGRARMTWG